jgi:hypothetical protein
MVGYAGGAGSSATFSASIDTSTSDMDKVVFMTLTVEGAKAEALTARVVSRKAVFIIMFYCV